MLCSFAVLCFRSNSFLPLPYVAFSDEVDGAVAVPPFLTSDGHDAHELLRLQMAHDENEAAAVFADFANGPAAQADGSAVPSHHLPPVAHAMQAAPVPIAPFAFVPAAVAKPVIVESFQQQHQQHQVHQQLMRQVWLCSALLVFFAEF